MKVGFTGTQFGMTSAQRREFIRFVESHQLSAFHHGDCIGADQQAHDIVDGLFDRPAIYVHPPTNESKRAHCRSGRILLIAKAKPYIERNHDIVNACDVLIATPKESTMRLRSGTWATIRYAAKQRHKEIVTIFPDGSILFDP